MDNPADISSEAAQAEMEADHPGHLPVPVCFRCKKTPGDLAEYVEIAAGCGMTPNHFVRVMEGTYNPRSHHFCCTSCYIDIGMPTARMGWKAP